LRGRHERRHQQCVGGDAWPVDGRGESRARPSISTQHDEPAGESGSAENAAAAPGPRQRRLQRGNERDERHSREEPDEDRNHHAVPVTGEEVRQLNGGCAGRGQDALDQVG